MTSQNPFLSHSPGPQTSKGKIRGKRKQTWASIIGGSALAVFGASRKNVSGVALAALGGYIAYRGLRSVRSTTGPVLVHRSFTINKPPQEIFQFWRNFENLPRFMQHLKSVKTTGDRFSHWVATGPLNTSVSWDAEITDERPNEFIVWRSVPGSEIANSGSVEFRPATFHGGTEITVTIQYDAPGGKLGSAFARIFGEHPEQQIREDLRRFKQLMEAGEIPTVVGQTSGRRTPWVRMMQAAENKREATMVREPQSNLA